MADDIEEHIEERLAGVAYTAQMGALVSQTLVEVLVRKGVLTIPDAAALFQEVGQRARSIGGPHNEAAAKTADAVAAGYRRMGN